MDSCIAILFIPFLGNAIVTSYQYSERLPASHAEYAVSKRLNHLFRVPVSAQPLQQGTNWLSYHFGPQRV